MDRHDRQDWFCYFLTTRHGPPDIYSGSTNNLERRMRQHNGKLAGGALRTKRWGMNNAKLVIVMGPMHRHVALAIERKLKTNVTTGKIAGRLKAIARMLSAPDGFVSPSAQLTLVQLRQIQIRTVFTREEVEGATQLTSTQLDQTAQWAFNNEVLLM